MPCAQSCRFNLHETAHITALSSARRTQLSRIVSIGLKLADFRGGFFQSRCGFLGCRDLEHYDYVSFTTMGAFYLKVLDCNKVDLLTKAGFSLGTRACALSFPQTQAFSFFP